MLFETFIRKKELEDYNKAIVKYSDDYAELKTLGEVNGHPIYHLTINPKGTKVICFIGGLHGNEVAGPYGILEFLKQGIRVPKDKRVEIIPIANPTGFINRTRDGVEVDRQFYESNLPPECEFVWKAVNKSKLDYLHTLHEDPEVKSFYLYFTHHNTLAKGLRDNVAKKYFPIQSEDEKFRNDKINDGLIPLPHTKRNSIEDRVLEELGVPYITTETPGKGTLRTRVLCNRDIIKYVIHNF